jgi:hypothetical protein
MEIIAYEKNCQGDFIVEDGVCILCCLPETEAPDLMASDDLSCYFKKQPSSEPEIDRAIEAIKVSCCEAVRYVGTDKKIIRRILTEEYTTHYCVPKATKWQLFSAKLVRWLTGKKI